MELTLIKIPGKRKRKSPVLNSANSGGDQHSNVNRRKRRKTRTLENLKSQSKMSTLERLPTELLETIFLYSMNLGLPRASPVIGGKLSSEPVYSRTIDSAFGLTWGAEDYETLERSDSQWDTSIAGLQSAVLRCRWADLPRILKVKAKYEPNIYPWTCPPDPSELSAFHASNQGYLDEDFALFSSFVVRVESLDLGTIFHTNRGDVAKGVEIPDRLLVGPWTEDQIRMLFWLVRGGARVSWLTSTTGEASTIGLKKAISIGDVRAICLLSWAHAATSMDEDFIVWAVHNVGGDKIKVFQCLTRLADIFHHLYLWNVSRMVDELDHVLQEARQETKLEKVDLLALIQKAWANSRSSQSSKNPMGMDRRKLS